MKIANHKKRTPLPNKLIKEIYSSPDPHYSDTGIIGACKQCELVATLEVGPGFSLAQLDKTAGGGVLKAWCPKCNKTVEFVPHQHFLDEAHVEALRQQVKPPV